jgi:hypothetical protein
MVHSEDIMANTTNTTNEKVRDIKATVLRINPATKQPDENGIAVGLSLAFSHGRMIRLVSSELPEHLQHEALIHGLKQKLVDAAAISRDTKTGKSATIEQKYDAVKAVYDRLLNGTWNEEREGGGQASYLLQAIMRVKGKDEATVREWLGKKSDAEKKALELNPAISSVITELKAAKAKDVDSDALLGELE